MAAVEAAGPAAAPDYEAAELYTRVFRVGALGRCWRQQLGPPDLSLAAEAAAELGCATEEELSCAAAELGCAAETAAELRAVCRWPRGRRRAREGRPDERPGPRGGCAGRGPPDAAQPREGLETSGFLQAGSCGPGAGGKLVAPLGAGAGGGRRGPGAAGAVAQALHRLLTRGGRRPGSTAPEQPSPALCRLGGLVFFFFNHLPGRYAVEKAHVAFREGSAPLAETLRYGLEFVSRQCST